MRTRWVLMGMAAAMATAWAGVNALHAVPPPADVDMTTASIARPAAPAAHEAGESFVIRSALSDASCVVAKGEELSPGYAKIRVTSACEQLLPGLASARFWREREDGSVALSAAGDPIAEFAAGDGVDYESYAPASAMLTIKAQ